MAVALMGLSFLVFGAISIWDALRISGTVRLRGTLDLVGPDGYLLGVAVLLIVVGFLLLIQGVSEARKRPRPRRAGMAKPKIAATRTWR